MSDYRRWASEEEQYIRDHWKTQSDAEMAAVLERMEGAVRNRRREGQEIWYTPMFFSDVWVGRRRVEIMRLFFEKGESA